jgi:hypothetical protein
VVSWNRSARARKRGVAERIKINEGAIGYVEFWFAQRLELRTAVLQNKAGKFIIPTASSGELALSGTGRAGLAAWRFGCRSRDVRRLPDTVLRGCFQGSGKPALGALQPHASPPDSTVWTATTPVPKPPHRPSGHLLTEASLDANWQRNQSFALSSVCHLKVIEQ